jgi:hypothetical protein
VVSIGDRIVASSGSSGPAILTMADCRTGEIVWRTREFAKAQVLAAGEKILILDEEGTLAVATASPAGLKVRSRAAALDGPSLAPPALAGSQLYVRHRTSLTRFDLSR